VNWIVLQSNKDGNQINKITTKNKKGDDDDDDGNEHWIKWFG
jgi:hypothetical protein